MQNILILKHLLFFKKNTTHSNVSTDTYSTISINIYNFESKRYIVDFTLGVTKKNDFRGSVKALDSKITKNTPLHLR